MNLTEPPCLQQRLVPLRQLFRQLSPFGLSLAFPLVGLVSTAVVGVPYLINPPAAVAYTSRVNLFLTREPGESFEVFIQRAEIIARAAIQRSFDADIVMTDVIVTVVGDNQSVAVPILTVEVSRNEWQLQPDVEYWGTYYEAAEGLLRSGT